MGPFPGTRTLPLFLHRVPHNVITFLGLSERELFVAALMMMMRGKNFTYCSSDLHGCVAVACFSSASPLTSTLDMPVVVVVIVVMLIIRKSFRCHTASR